MAIKINWVLNNKLAVGPVPRKMEDLKALKNNRIRWILSLCSENEVNVEVNYEDNFSCKRIVLPDHKYKEALTIDQLNLAINTLEEIIEFGPIYVHCVAGVERSPLVCMAWLVKHHNLTCTEALDYLMNVNTGTNPLPEQFKLLKLIKNKKIQI